MGFQWWNFSHSRNSWKFSAFHFKLVISIFVFVFFPLFSLKFPPAHITSTNSVTCYVTHGTRTQWCTGARVHRQKIATWPCFEVEVLLGLVFDPLLHSCYYAILCLILHLPFSTSHGKSRICKLRGSILSILSILSISPSLKCGPSPRFAYSSPLHCFHVDMYKYTHTLSHWRFSPLLFPSIWLSSVPCTFPSVIVS